MKHQLSIGLVLFILCFPAAIASGCLMAGCFPGVKVSCFSTATGGVCFGLTIIMGWLALVMVTTAQPHRQ